MSCLAPRVRDASSDRAAFPWLALLEDPARRGAPLLRRRSARCPRRVARASFTLSCARPAALLVRRARCSTHAGRARARGRAYRATGTSASSPRPAVSARPPSATARRCASTASSSCTNARARAPASASRRSAPRPSSSACRSARPPTCTTPATPRARRATRRRRRGRGASAGGSRWPDARSPSCGGAYAAQHVDRRPQIWPEHFDLACELGADAGTRARYGASPGDAAIPQPYLYVGPWDASPQRARLGAYPFGAGDHLRRARDRGDPAGRAARCFDVIARSARRSTRRAHPGVRWRPWRRPSPGWTSRPPSSGRSSARRRWSTRTGSPRRVLATAALARRDHRRLRRRPAHALAADGDARRARRRRRRESCSRRCCTTSARP